MFEIFPTLFCGTYLFFKEDPIAERLTSLSDLSPLNFFFWEHLKSEIYATTLNSI